jgi:hypothetical protein
MDDKTVEEVAAPAKIQFEGFRKPEKPNKNFYHVPNEWTDIMAGIDNLSELKVIEYIMRHTWGFKEYGTLKLFTTEEFVNGRKRKDGTRMDKGTGLGTTAAKQGIAKAIENGYVICETDESDKGRIKKYYGLKMLPTPDLDSHNVTIDSHNPTMHGHDTTPDGHNETTHSHDATSRVSEDDHRSEKETPEINLEKNTIERKNGASRQEGNATTGEESSHSFTHSSKNFSSSSQETKQTKPEVELSPEEQRIHGYWQELGFEADITAKLKEHWSKLVDCIQSFDQFKSLYEHTRQQIESNPEIKNKRVNPGNLTNANNLNGWKQAQEKKSKVMADNKHLQPINKAARTGHAEMIINYNKKAIARGWLIAKDEGFMGDTATDTDIANVVNKWSHLYKDAEHAEEHLKSAKKIQYHCALDNNSFFAMLHDVKDDTDNSGDKSMSMFLAILAKKLLGCNQTLSTSNQKPAEQDATPQKRLPSLNSTRPNNREPLSDNVLRDRIGRLCKTWQDDNLETHFQEAKRLQQEFGLDNDELSNSISKVVPETARYDNPTMQDLFKNLRSALSSKAAACAG